MIQQEVSQKELIRILHIGEIALKVYALQELNRQKILVPFHELEPAMLCSDEKLLAALVCYGQLLTPEERIKIGSYLIQSTSPANLRGLADLMPGCHYPTDILKFVLKQIPICKEITLKKALISILEPHVPKLPAAFFQPLIKHPSLYIVLEVIRLLAIHPKPSFRPLLEECQYHEDPRIQTFSLVGLWKLGDPTLLEQFPSKKCPRVLELFTHALGSTGADPSVQSLLDRLTENLHHGVRHAAYSSLERVGRRDKVPEYLLRAVDEPSLPVCAAMIRTCLKLNEDETIRTLLNLIELYREVGDLDSLEKVNYFIELTPHYKVALDIMRNLNKSHNIHESRNQQSKVVLDLNLIQGLVDYLQLMESKSSFDAKNLSQSLNRFEFSDLLG